MMEHKFNELMVMKCANGWQVYQRTPQYDMRDPKFTFVFRTKAELATWILEHLDDAP